MLCLSKFTTAICSVVAAVGLVPACTWQMSKPSRPSILVVAIDRLGVNHVTCDSGQDDASRSGFSELCDESVRFTHAFTTSTLSAPAMSSILTGLYPFHTGLRHNGAGELGTLSSDLETLAEKAFSVGYRTYFAAGAAPLLRRTGLHQGFEIFDDAIHAGDTRVHRPARETIEGFRQWLGANDNGQPFFTVLHLADLQIPWQPMPDALGRLRESTVGGQLEEIDDSLARLWADLRRRRRWESTAVVVVGLQGDFAGDRPNEIPSVDLHSETAHVALLIKGIGPTARQAAQQRAEKLTGQPKYNWVPTNWSFDVNVSLADVGATLHDFMGFDAPSDESRSLVSALSGPSEEVERWRKLDRLVLTESAWAKWQIDSALPIRVALRRGPYLYLHDESAAIYNTLTDAPEVAPLPRKNSNTIELQRQFDGIATEFGFRRFPALSANAIAEERWMRSFFGKRVGNTAAENLPVDQQRIEVLAERSDPTSALANWWRLYQSQRTGQPLEANACTKTIFSNRPDGRELDDDIARLCAFRGAREVARWLRMPVPGERERVFEAIRRFDSQRRTAAYVAEASLALGRIWETGETRRHEWDGLEIVLAQPEAARLRADLMRRTRTQSEP